MDNQTTPEPTHSIIPGNDLGGYAYPDDVSFVAARGTGSHLIARDGRDFVDYVLGSGPMVIGHAHPRVVEAVARQAALGTHFYILNERALELAAKINGHVPCAEAVRFTASGTEATAYAMRFARSFTGRTKILKFEGAYHGNHDYAQVGRVAKLGHNSLSHTDSAGVPASIADTIVVGEFNDLEMARQLAADNSADLAAILVEPVQRAIPPQPGFLKGLREIADQTGALLIFDEMVTGFRMEMGGAQQAYGVTPDLCTLGKVIGGGLPLAAIAGRRDVLELTVSNLPQDERAIWFSGTLNGNPLSCAAGIATLEVLEDEDGPRKLEASGRLLADGLTEIARSLSIPFQMIGHPAFAEPVFSETEIRNARDLAATNRAAIVQLSLEMMRRNVHVMGGGKWHLSTVHSSLDLDFTMEAARSAMKAVRDGGYLEARS
ncbi:aminotransferase class III-fold pyridoxal phosphate-dependent enzyme [Mesorhizobium sp. M7A.F.Ca.US.006.01.1.1]|uniref:aspartate aminotransferase family protein n=1 Tax=Mesorhizobium sp. M7A.F.Ca.US.006.01.1.1 TaxID=2496707 RepID=UPI000FCA8709|nr:aminotransferase class III-fold pyridoxal phosphate-dependent enzyme [Mesorhizobium sp. M7A.F.Ca.US.006.01.1.1]RUZ72336.1 aminotransferase class III-fold pyridoxal phosphate-dependent enzyme [Mesorhizobium sp. M7A.F.Ca.US.006.01.1.1]